jgi:hypothetical protein
MIGPSTLVVKLMELIARLGGLAIATGTDSAPPGRGKATGRDNPLLREVIVRGDDAPA